MNFDTGLQDDVSPEARLLRKSIEQAIQLVIATGHVSNDYRAGLIYLGNPHVAIPQLLLMHTELGSHEKVIWALKRNAIQHPGAPALAPSQSELAAQTGLVRQTVNRKIQVLRIRRWITLCARIRLPDGEFSRPIWAIHDQPLPLADSLYLDEGYLEYLDDETHNRRQEISQLATQELARINAQVAAPGDHLSACPLAGCVTFSQHKPVGHGVGKFDTGDRVALSDTVGDRGHRVASGDTENNQRLTAENQDHGVASGDTSSCSSNLFKKTTTTVSPEATGLRFPNGLTHPERVLAIALLKSLPADQRQFPLDYLRDRMADRTQAALVNKLAYLRRIIQLLREGALEPSSYGLCAANSPNQPTTPPDTEPDADTVFRQWREHMRRLGKDPDALLAKKRLN